MQSHFGSSYLYSRFSSLCPFSCRRGDGGGGAVADDFEEADAGGDHGRVVAACLGWYAFGAVRGVLHGDGSTAPSRMGLRPDHAMQERALLALRVCCPLGLRWLFSDMDMDGALFLDVDLVASVLVLSLELVASPPAGRFWSMLPADLLAVGSVLAMGASIAEF